jgi:hypothetical protein
MVEMTVGQFGSDWDIEGACGRAAISIPSCDVTDLVIPPVEPKRLELSVHSR